MQPEKQTRHDSVFTREITDATLDDSEALTELSMRSKAKWGYDRSFMAACRDELTVTAADIARDLVRTVRFGGRIVGFFRLSLTRQTGEVEGFFVDPLYDGRGIGRALWRDLLVQSRARGLRELQLDSDPNAEGFYIRMGMRRAGKRPSGSIGGRFLTMMVLTLGDRNRADA